MEIAEFPNKLDLLIYLLNDNLNKGLLSEPNTEKETIILKIDSNYYKIMIKIGKFESQLKILQILNAISFFLVFDPPISKFYTLKLSLSHYFNPQVRNSYKLQNNDIYFKKGGKDRLLGLFEARIVNRLKKTHVCKFTDIIEPLFLRICGFLDEKALWGLIRSSLELYMRFFIRNEFWNIMYDCRFGRTGFKGDLIKWKEVYLKKLKEKTKKK